MNDQLKRYIDPIKRFWKNLTKKKKIILVSILGGVIALAAVVEILLSMPTYVVLYPSLDKDEAVDVMNELKSRNVDYKEDNGSISVPKDKENALRMELANAGYPKSSLNYDFFTENSGVMTTDKERNLIEKYQLNQRLESVIKTFDCIQNASVTINVPDENTYAWETDKKASTASVTVTMDSGKTLDSSQVNGIKQLVSKSVPNLSSDDVAVIDTATGKELDAKNAVTSIDISEFKRTIEKEYESDIAANALKVLVPVFGEGNVQVTAKSIMDVDKKVSEILTYMPSEDNKGVISESTSNQEQEKASSGSGNVAAGTETNTEKAATYSGVTVDGDTIYTKDEQTYKYLVSQTKQQIQSDAASLKDMTVSVVINQPTMTDEKKDEVSKLVANSAAINSSKVVVYTSEFVVPQAKKADVQPKNTAFNIIYLAAGAALAGLLLLLLIFFWILSASRKRKLKKLMALAEGEDTPSEEEVKLPSLSQEEEAAIKARKDLEALHVAQQDREDELRKDLQDFSSQNPEIVAQLIKSWLRGDDNNA